MEVKIKKLSENAIIPSYAKDGDAAVDLTAISYEYSNGRHVYGTGLAVEIPPGFVGLIFPRSSICKYDLALTNSVGVIDSGYRGEIKFQFAQDDSDLRVKIEYYSFGHFRTPKIYEVGERIGQLMILPYPKINFREIDELNESERGTGGFGHTGV